MLIGLKTIGLFIVFSFSIFSQEYPRQQKTSDYDIGEFRGRFSKLNAKARLARIRVNFDNVRYLNPGDKISFWTNAIKKTRCEGILKGKSNDYILISILDYFSCVKRVGITPGAYVYMHSKDLVSNIERGKETIDIMLKRRMALVAKKRRLQKELEQYVSKVEAVNKRYQVLREKLEKEWRESLVDIEEDKSVDLRQFKNTEIQLGELDYKLERYRITDQNLELDRWSLDKRLYFKK